ncbi:MFS transporter [Duganella sp. LX20W]|uniref:MFS transporter n=1 Tax=Rugamonas brunnea TaxID=2758569 RepID=A0A7W2IAJ9_9BURK|nr:MFS transporter [Rugamonas brunnea]MBA5635967.1 MFS transporter [Rugamonas brunnea]
MPERPEHGAANPADDRGPAATPPASAPAPAPTPTPTPASASASAPTPASDNAPASGWRSLDPDILKLGLVSFLTDLSSEMIFSVFAIFFTTVAGASSSLLGLIEGLADFSSASLNYLSGWLSDRGGRRKALVVAGYGFSTLAKTILLVSTAITGLALFRVIERLGKSFRGPPRDAWLAAIAPSGRRGYAFGVHKALDKSGAVVGPLVAWALLTWLGESAHAYRLLFWVAVVPAVVSVLVLATVDERTTAPHARESVWQNWHALSPGFKRFLLPAGLFALAYYSLGFLLLKAHEVGFGVTEIVLLYAFFNVTCVLAAPSMGRLGDRIGRRHVIMLGYLLHGLLNVWLALSHDKWQMVAAFGVYGLFYAIDEAQSKAYVADLEPERRASAIGIYSFVTGALYLPASLLAGALWAVNPAWTFGAAALLSLAAIIVFAKKTGVRS